MTDLMNETALASTPAPKYAPAAAEPLSYSVKGAMMASGLGRSTIFSLLASGKLARVKVGKRTLIPRRSLEALLSGEAE